MSSKTREALSEILDLIDKWRTDGVMEHWQYSQLFDVADTALAEPIRNCDIGTADEQIQRLWKYWQSSDCYDSPCYPSSVSEYISEATDCAILWSQKPYKKGDVK